jgi:hypothetical protein
MAEEPVNDPPRTNTSINDDDARSNSGAESPAISTSSSLTRSASLMAEGEIPKLTDLFKKIVVTEEECMYYHAHGWLTSNVLSTIPEVDVPTVCGSSVLCFESHLLVVLGLPPSKFLAAIMNYLGCSVVHFNPSAIATLNTSVMLCECGWGLHQTLACFGTITPYPGTPNSSMAGSDCPCVVITEMSISRHFSRAALKIPKKWFLVDMHVQPSWEIKLLFPLVIKAQRQEPPMITRLTTLFSHISELCGAGLKVCHYIKEFHLLS